MLEFFFYGASSTPTTRQACTSQYIMFQLVINSTECSDTTVIHLEYGFVQGWVVVLGDRRCVIGRYCAMSEGSFRQFIFALCCIGEMERYEAGG